MRRALCASLAVLIAMASEVDAKEYNERPFVEPRFNSKIQRVISNGRTQQFRTQDDAETQVKDNINTLNPNSRITNTGCGKLKVGGVTTTGRRGERAPRENITVVGDVINAPVNCGVRRRIGN